MNTARGGANAQKGASRNPSSHAGEAGDTGKAHHDLRDDVDSLEETITDGCSIKDALQIHAIQPIST